MPVSTMVAEGRELALATAGGLIVVGGPPFHGKSLLAARLADALPFAHRLEATDNLSTTSEYWDPTGLMVHPYQRPLARMLRLAVDIWDRRQPLPPVVIIAARAATPAARRMARRTAADAGVRFLHVEALAHNIRAFQRLSSLMLAKAELLERMERYERAMEQYVPVSGDEEDRLPAVRVQNVLSRGDAATRAVLERWL